MPDEISGQVTENGTPVENAVVTAVKQTDPSQLSQSTAQSVESLSKLTDSNGNYVFTPDELFLGTENYHVVARKDAGEKRRSRESFPFVEGVGRSNLNGVTSRPGDTDSANLNRSLGVVFTPAADFDNVGFRISSRTTDTTRALLFDYSQSQFVIIKDITSLSSGDVETFNHPFIAGRDYGIELDAGGASYSIGFASDTTYPFTGEDIDIIARSDGGSQTVQNGPTGVNDIGNPDNVLG
jgi:hypothetical protein